MDNILATDEYKEVDGLASEIWKDIPGWEGLYQASNLGRIKRLPLSFIYSDGQRHYYPEKIYVPSVSGNGYKQVTLRRPGGEQQHLYVHRLVAKTFLERPEGCDVINHLDADKTNNNIENLEWTTLSGNSIHSIHHYGKIGVVRMHPVICVETGEEFPSSADAARWLKKKSSNIKASTNNIWATASGQRPIALGYHWKFKENI